MSGVRPPRGQYMSNLKSSVCNALLGMLLIAMPGLVFANSLKDAGFEAQTASGGDWTLFDQSRVSSDLARSGSQSMFNWGFSRTIPTPPFLLGTAAGSFQEFNAVAGSRWRLTGYGRAADPIRGAPAFGILQISFFDSAGKDLGTVETASEKTAPAKTSNQINSKSPVGEWISLDTGIATAPDGTAKVQAFTLFVDYSGSEISQGVYFDDLKLCEVSADHTNCP